jgi:MoaA/NifB/PqqE/SkfB family radical SAM enzyme
MNTVNLGPRSLRSRRPGLATLAREGAALAERLRPHLDPPQRGPRELARRAHAYRTAASNFLENRRRQRAGREDLLPLYFIWTLLRQCNFRCTYCDDHRGHKYPDLDPHGTLTTEQGIRLLEVMRTRTPSVYFAGGEPTIRPDLPALTRAARDQGYFPLVVNTNGSLFHKVLPKPSWSTFLADIDLVVVSLDALDPAVLGPLWVTKRPDDVLRNLFALAALKDEQRFKLMVNCVIRPGHAADAREVLDLAGDLGVTFCAVPVNRGPAVDGDQADDRDYQDLVATILARKRAGQPIAGSLRMNERLLASAPLDCRNTLKPHIDFDGRLAWPCKATVNVAPEMIDVLAFDDVDALWAHACTLVDPTRFHGVAKNQCGAACNWAQNYTTDAYADGLRRPWRLLADVVQFTSRT